MTRCLGILIYILHSGFRWCFGQQPWRIECPPTELYTRFHTTQSVMLGKSDVYSGAIGGVCANMPPLEQSSNLKERLIFPSRLRSLTQAKSPVASV